ncbi:hypothetical protein C8R45DRAFT_1215308 [Mycena sanguinolenta]|nr:hypothetical protein C8R45DRAFT_1215308 [Mycena sanguinolenta]
MHFLYLLAFSSSLWKLAQASLYPTHPTADTSLTPGTWVNFTWIDKRDQRPYLSEIGSMRIDLCNTDGTLVATLARRVSPVARRHLVQIPQNLALSRTAPEFVVQFISAYPILITWTANFEILSLITDSVVSYSELDDPTTDELLTLVLPTTTLVTTLTPAAVVPAVATVVAGPLPDDGAAGAGVYQPSGANPSKDSITLVFVVWPALVGISMAL